MGWKSMKHPVPQGRPKNLSLSIFIITLNEQKNIGRCLQSLKFSKKLFTKREVIVVDAGSGDATVSIARKWGARVFTRPWKGYSDQKNWALAHCKGNWILSLDADEELTPELVSEIEGKVPLIPLEVDGYFIKRKAFFLGKWIRHCGWWPDSQLRLIKRGTGKFTHEPVHEGLEVKGRTLELDQPMNHYTYDSIRQYLDKMNRYSDLALLDMKPKKIKYWKFYGTVAPLLTFFRMYVSRRGHLDGWHGLVVCGLSAFHDFCKYAKMWEKEILKRHVPISKG
jgi:glycosyltransferase involved in cell wall biosynthesis